MNPSALPAIVRARLFAQRHALAYASAGAFAGGFAQPNDLAIAVCFCSLLGVILTLLQLPGRYPHLDLCEQGAPLFGRELARGKALAACSASLLTTLAYFAGAFAAGSHRLPMPLVQTAAAVVASTLTALSATTRNGASRLLYLALACAIAGGAFAIGGLGRSLLGELAFCALASALALRQYGESLARYDPI